MLEAYNEVKIQATVEEVWKVLTDFSRYAEWNPLIHRVETKLAVGEPVQIWVKGVHGDQEIHCEMASLKPPYEFSWKFHEIMPFLYRGEHFFRVEPIDDQWVRYIDREIFAGLLAPLKVKLPEGKAPAGMIAMGEALKAQLKKMKII